MADAPLPALSPYARRLGMTHARDGTRIVVAMPPGDDVVGRPGFLHGGAIAGLVEMAAWAAVLDALATDPGARLKPVSISVDFLRGGRLVESHATARIVRQGRRIANVEAWCWQDDEAAPLAIASVKFLIKHDDPDRA